jgi:tungstate transport system substrate-binding protein
MQLILIAMAALLAAACSTGAERRDTLDVATTTSVQNSGLLDALLPQFPQATVRVHAAGSGRSLEMLKDGIVDLVLTHAPETEARYLTAHPAWRYRKFASNRFIIVGPPGDPAGIRGAADAVDAFRRIAGAPVTFVSRGDQSGTHERELSLWKAAGVTPRPERWLISGSSMAVALRQAQERQGYTLADEATFWQMERQLDLVSLVAGDDRLLNTYAVIHPPGNRVADAFAAWIVEGDGRRIIERYTTAGRVAFTPWPLACPAETPEVTPCT